jgi:hypothetical protein
LRRCTVLTVLAVLAGCGGEDPIPAQPTWVDVEPILRANCFHCHGAVQQRLAPTAFRWDTFAKAEAMKALQLDDLGDKDNPILDAPVGIATFLSPDTMEPGKPKVTNFFGAAFMPPPPGDPLSERDLAVLRAWAPRYPKGTRASNQKPTAAWLTRPTLFEVSDGDHEPVLGKLTCGTIVTPLPRGGGWNLPAGSRLPCTVALYDGWDTVTTTLE